MSLTNKETMLAQDINFVEVMVKQKPKSCQIFLTGEILGERCTREDLAFFYKANDLLPVPLFRGTRDATMAMLRYDARIVWPLIPKKLMEVMVRDESEWFEVKLEAENLTGGRFDYYEDLLDLYRGGRKYCAPAPAEGGDLSRYDVRYQALYMASLLIFRKGGFMGEHPARFFATDATACFLEDTSFRPLTEEELGIVEEAEKAGKDIRALTNAELEAVTKICGESYKDVDGYTGKDPRSVIRGPWEAG